VVWGCPSVVVNFINVKCRYDFQYFPDVVNGICGSEKRFPLCLELIFCPFSIR
jgi:hypothetical protein